MSQKGGLVLHWSDVDLEAGLLRVRGTLARVDGALTVTATKTEKSRRTVPLSPAAVEILRDVVVASVRSSSRPARSGSGRPAVFTTEFGEPRDPRNALRALKTAAASARLPGVGLHTLRHSAASVMSTNGVPLKVVSAVLGQASIAITGDVYGDVAPDVSRGALETLSAALNAELLSAT